MRHRLVWRRTCRIRPRSDRNWARQSTPGDVYDPERLRDYVAAFILAGLDPEVGAEAEFFAERVDYFGQPNVSREKIRNDLLRYDKRWPQRQFRLAGDLETARQTNGTVRVTFPLRYELHNGSKSASGTVRKTIILRKTNDSELEIVRVTELENGRNAAPQRGLERVR